MVCLLIWEYWLAKQDLDNFVRLKADARILKALCGAFVELSLTVIAVFE